MRAAYDPRVRVARVERPDELPRALQELGFVRPQPTLVVVGGADGLSGTDRERVVPLIEKLTALAERRTAVVVDGGTDSGVMQLLGRARRRRPSFALLGVAVAALAHASLEPNHSHVLLVPGAAWGDEVPWLTRTAGILAGDQPSLTVLVNGGEIAYADAAASIEEGRRVVVVAGSGRLADAVAAASRGQAEGSAARTLAASDLVSTLDLGDDPELLLVERLLAAGS